MRAIFAQPPDQRAIIRLASQEMPHISPEAQAEFGCLYHDKSLGHIEAILRAGIKAGELRSADAGRATWVPLGMMYPFFYPPPPRDSESGKETIDLLLTVFFDVAGAIS